jgi:fibronectin-binding autotransporter adhesin
MSTRKRLKFCAAISLAAIGVARPLLAISYTWTGSSNGAWINSANWNPSTGSPNATTDTADFTGGTQTTVSISGTQTVGSLTFDSNVTSGFSITGGSLDLADGTTITKQAGSATTTDTIASSIVLLGSATAKDTSTAAFSAGQGLVLSGNITGTGALHVAGGSAGVVFSGNSTGFSGVVSIDSGYFLPTTNTAVGTGIINMSTGTVAYLTSTSNMANNWNILGNAEWGSFSGNTQSGNVNVSSGAVWNIDNGGGNYLGLPGVISGSGSIYFTAANTTFSGTSSNTLSGLITEAANSSTTSFDTLTLDKTGGATAIAGNLQVANLGIISWDGNNEIASTSNIQLSGGTLQLNGYSNTVGTLTLSGSANIDVSGGSSALHFADSSGVSWTGKQVLIDNWTSTRNISFGTTASGLTSSQLNDVGFYNPSGFSAGLYHATISSSGIVSPTGSAVTATNPLWNMSSAAVAARTAVYNVPGLTELSGTGTPLTAGTNISFFGDSITWLNGYIPLIQSALTSGTGSKNLGVNLYNHGINGGGVYNVANGSATNAYTPTNNNASQLPFAQVIAADHSNVAVVFIGVNDVRLLGTSASNFQSELTSIVTTGEDAGVKMVLATVELAGEMPDGTNTIVGNYDAQMDQFAAITRTVANSSGATLVDLRTAAQDYEENNNYTLNLDGSLNYQSDGILTYDGIHPTSTGNSFLANLLSDGIYRAEESSVVGGGPVKATYIATGSGDFNATANWSTASIPTGVDSEADFLSSITSAQTVYSNSNITVGTMVFNNSNTYVLAGAGNLKFQVSTGSALVNTLAGTQKITLPIEVASNTVFNASSGATLVIEAPVTIDPGMSLSTGGVGAVQFQSTITVDSGGRLAMSSASNALSLSLLGVSNGSLLSTTGTKTALQLQSLSIASGSSFNLTNNDMVIHGGSLSAIQAEIATGFNGGAWTGTGIDSSTAASDSTHLTAVGVMLNTNATGSAIYNSFGNVPVNAGDVLIKETYYGDANLNGKVDGSDYSLIDNGYEKHLTGWYNGDFNYDGTVNGSDYTLIDNAFNSQGASLASQVASPDAIPTIQLAGTAAVPEPTTLAIVFIGATSLLGRPRRMTLHYLAK